MKRIFLLCFSTLLAGCAIDTGSLINEALVGEQAIEIVKNSSDSAQQNSTLVQKIEVDGLGIVLADLEGLPLYTTSADLEGKSSCYEACTQTWLPVLVEADFVAIAPYSTLERDSGTLQLRYNNQPLYTYIQDIAGVVKGNSIDGWQVVIIK